LTPELTNSWEADGDAESVVLADGTWMTAACCADIVGKSSFPLYYTFNESSLNFTTVATSTDGQFDDFDEQGFTPVSYTHLDVYKRQLLSRY